MRRKIAVTQIGIGVLAWVVGQLFIGCTRDKSPLSPMASKSKPLNPPIIDENVEIELRIVDGQLYQLINQKKVPSQAGWSRAPDSIITKSQAYLVWHLGESYFNTYFDLRSAEIIPADARSEESRERFCVVFYYAISIEDYTTYLLVATYHDSSGQVVRDEGVVNRIADPTLGMPFSIDDREAVAIAKNWGLAPGVKPWRVSFYYFAGVLKRYVWGIMQWESWSTGQTLIIDPATGLILRNASWIAVP